MRSRNPYKPPGSDITPRSSLKHSDGRATKRALRASVGSGLAAVVGFGAGMFCSTLYRRHYYPNDLDPVDLTIGAILLWVWLGTWLAGTVLAAWLAFRSYPRNAA